MSGGSMDYLYSKIEMDLEFKEDTPIRRAFKLHMLDVVSALHDIEWVDSGDMSTGDDDEAIKRCIGSDLRLKFYVEEAQDLINELTTLLHEIQ